MKQLVKKSTKKAKLLIGWKEWCALPELGIDEIKAKVDTGAATSALHALILGISEHNGEKYIQFKIFPHQKDLLASKIAKAKLIAQRNIMSSNGIKEKRFVIETTMTVGRLSFKTQLTLSDRSPLRFRMLLGRMALRKHFLIDPSKAHLQDKPLIGA